MLDNAATAVPGGGASDPMANDKLGTDDFRKNPSWLRATERHLDALPKNRLVDAFRRYHFGAGGVNHDGLVVTPSPPGCGHPPQGADTLPTGFSSSRSSSPSPSYPQKPKSRPDNSGWLPPTGSRSGGVIR